MTRRSSAARARTLGVLCVGFAFAGGAAAADGVSPRPSAARTATVTISSFTFRPGTVRIRRGTTVVVRNHDAANHSFTARNGAFELSNIPDHSSARLRLNHRGTYRYYCVFHPFMHGTIVVR